MSSDFSTLDERTRLLCEAWERMIRERGYDGPMDYRLRQVIVHGSREWLEVFGESLELLQKSLDKMLESNLTVKSPASCITIARTMKYLRAANDTEARRRRYAESLRRWEEE